MTKNVEVDDRVWQALRERADQLFRMSVKVGVVGSQATEHHDADGDATNAEIAAALHLGTPTIPSRPFIRQAFLTRRGEFLALAQRLAKAFLLGRMSGEQVMGLLGAWGAGAIKATITRTGSFAPLAPSTIARKKSSRPLVDTGQLVNSVSFVVIA